MAKASYGVCRVCPEFLTFIYILMKKFLLSITGALLLLSACKETIDTSARYVFTDNTVVSYLEHFDEYSEYVELLKQVPVSPRSESSVYQLMAARGNYTCFAYTNETIREYLQTVVEEGLIDEPTWGSFTDSTKLDSIRRVIVHNSIIDGGDLASQRFEISEFPLLNNAEFPIANMAENKYTVYWSETNPDSVSINTDCAVDIKNRDILVTNGVIHRLSKVVAPNPITASKFIQRILDNGEEGLLVISRAIQAAGLMDTLSVVRDEVYEEKYQTGQIPDLKDFLSLGFVDPRVNKGTDAYAPPHRLIGFTIFAETDDYWRAQGLDPHSPNLLEELTQWILENRQYSEDDVFKTSGVSYDSPQHLLYQWVTYHILPMRIPANRLLIHANEYGYSASNPGKFTIPVVEYYTTMGKRRLLKLYESGASNGVYLNRFPILDDGRRGTGLEIGCDADKTGCYVVRDGELTNVQGIVNACIYPIDKPLSYNDDVRNHLMKDHIRFDGFAIFPEAMTNELRRKESKEDKHMHIYIPPSSVYQYFDNMTLNDDCMYVYFNGWGYNWCNYSCDEIKALGRYDVTMKLPPVPRKGIYELRYKILANSVRGTCQMYFGSDPNNLPVTGIPVDLTIPVNHISTGWERDTEDDSYNAEVDKRMRNNMIMKGIKSVNDEVAPRTEREKENCSRRIVTRQMMDPDKTYYIRFKSVLDSDRKELYMDYMEFVSKEIFDNPEKPENIW